ncbi:hypothetical protein Tco_0524685 [Tanacetum coccineum]
MRLNEIHKFSDGTLTRVMEKLDHMVKDFHLFEYNKGTKTRKWSEDDKRRSKDFITVIEKRLQIRRIFQKHPSETKVFHNEDGNPARANIKQALGYLKDGDGDGNSQPHKGVKASANSDVMYFFTSAQDGDPLQDDVRLCLGDDLKKAQDHSQRQANCIDQLHVMICDMEAMVDRLVVFDSLDCLNERKVVENNKLKALNDLIAQTEEAIRLKEGHVEVMDEAIRLSRSLTAEYVYLLYGSRCKCFAVQSNDISFFLSHSHKKVNNGMVTDVWSTIEDYRLAKDINRVSGEVNNVVVERSQFLEELDSLGVRPVPTKMAEFLKEIQTNDRETMAKLQILKREMELNAGCHSVLRMLV